MQVIVKYIWFLCAMLSTTFMFAQVNDEFVNQEPRFIVRGSVIESDTRKPIPNVNIEVNGGAYTTTNYAGDFRIEAKKGDELIIKHKDFETVYYTILSNERITVEVEPNKDEVVYKRKKFSRSNPNQFKSLIDSAETYLKKDAKRSIQFIEQALVESHSVKENAETYEVLGDIYMYWKQYDLAVSNYRISDQNVENQYC